MSRLVTWVLVVAAGVAAVLTLLPPTPNPDPASPQPSAARAFADVQRIGQRPHVAGSAEDLAVAQYVADTLRGIGFAPRFQDAVGVDGGSLGDGTAAAARLRNVVTTVPVTASTGTVFVVAHHDSVQAGPGANDDGAGTATLLETARWLKAHPPRNDVVLLSTDAEEACLCGAHAFVAQAPEAARGGVVLNIEARGTSGPPIMFETTRGNGAIVDTFGSAAPHPVATSFAVEVYRILPNDTDFSPFRDAGRFAGLNSAYIDGSAAYHGPEDTAARMDLGSLQAHLDNTAAVVDAFGAQDLRTLPAASDATYFPVFGFLLRYPGWLVWPIALAALLAVAGAAVVAVRRRTASPLRLLAGVAAGLVPIVVAPVLAQLVWRGETALRPAYGQLRDPWVPGWDRVAVALLTAAVLVAWFALFRRRIGVVALAVGGAFWLAVLGLGLAALAPGGSYLAAVPALVGGLALLVRRGGRTEASTAKGAAVCTPEVERAPGVERTTAVGRAPAGAQDAPPSAASAAAPDAPVAAAPAPARAGGAVAAITTALAAIVAVVVLLPTAVLFYPALGLAVAAVPAFVLALLGIALVPALDLLPAPRLMPAVALVAAVAVGVVGFVANTPSPTRPTPSQLMYLLDADTGTARWLSTETTPTLWTAQYLGGSLDGSVDGRAHLDVPGLTGDYASGPAQAAALRPATVEATRDGASATVRITPQRPVRLVALRTDGAVVRSATVAGSPVPVRDGRLDLVFHAPPPEGLDVRLELAAPGPVTLQVTDGSDGLAGLPGFRPRPPDVGIAGTHSSELLAVTHRQAL